MNTNPYAPPENFQHPHPQPQGQGSELKIEGNLIVGRDPIVLPDICVATGQTTDLIRINRKQWHVAPWVYITLLGGLIVLLIVYLVCRKQCTVVYSISRDVKKRKSMLNLIGGLLFAGVVANIVLLAISEGHIAFLVMLPVLLIAALVFLTLGSAAPRLVRHKQGQFWLKGCSPQFFACWQRNHSPNSSDQVDWL